MSKQLTKAEEQVMQVLWQMEKAFVKEVIAQMDEPKPAYTTVSTIIRILEKKGFIGFVAFGKTPTAAVSTGIRLVANEPKTFKIDNADKLAAIVASGTANVFVEELSE